MSNVILQPAGRSAEKHMWTIRDGVGMSRIKPYVDQEVIARLAALYPGGVARVWGLTPGAQGRNEQKWSCFQRNDVVLFCGHSRVFGSALLQYKLHSKKLAQALWGADKEGRTWEYTYFVGHLEPLTVSYTKLAEAAGYKPNFVVLILEQPRQRPVTRRLKITRPPRF
jgi:hypothetical protein